MLWLVAAQFGPRRNFWAWILPILVAAIGLAFVRSAGLARDKSANSVA